MVYLNHIFVKVKEQSHMRSRVKEPIGKPVLVRSSNKETNKLIVKKQRRMLNRIRKRRKHPHVGDTRLINAFGTNDRMIFIGSFD
jgi:hypothetical protein